MYAIYGNIYHQYTPFMLVIIYIPYMDPMGYIPTQPTVLHELPAPEICHHSAVPPMMPTGNARNKTLTKVRTETFVAVETAKRLPQHMVYPILNGAIIDLRI